MSENHPSWHDQALCRGLTALFFVDSGVSLAKAKALCGVCPSQEPCREAGMGEHFGLWGGLSERERRAERRETSPTLADAVIIHGAVAGDQAHLKLGHKTCAGCKAAMAPLQGPEAAEKAAA